jgi:hypothetical protein
MKIWMPFAGLYQRLFNNPQASFLFMDETQSDEKLKPRISALTGLVVPIRQYLELRTQFYAALHHYVVPKPGHIAMPAEMHGKLLPGTSDEEKIANVAAIVKLVISNRLKVYRIGYYITDDLQAATPGDQWMLGTSWGSMLHVLEPVLAGQMLIPVMDGFDLNMVRSFSSTVRWCNVMHAAGSGRNVSINHSQQLLSEVVYTSSEYSVFTQVVDVLAYLRKITDMKNDGWPLPPFKASLFALAQKLAPVMAEEHIIAMTLDDVPQGPKHMARKRTGKGPLVACWRIIPRDPPTVAPHQATSD